MATGAHIAMPTEAQILTLAQWFSPGFPVGAFAYSHGLEWAVESGAVQDASGVEQWIADVLRHGAGWNDALFVAAGFEADTALGAREVDGMCRAFAASGERLKESDLQGRAFCDTVAAVWATELDGLCYPVAVGRAARLESLPVRLCTQMFLQAFLSNLVAAAQRLLPIGQTRGQEMIRALTPVASEIAIAAQGAGLGALSSTAFHADIASMKHETQYSRMFRT
ncbi:urease accessory protein UreF [Rhodobacteraceae bacterium D3-12]|nr:urease accessory protein UreF [Rhodobacteraceae bacterium D3-12]